MERKRPTVKAMRELHATLELLTEAFECWTQPHPIEGLVSPENPGGQMTATRRDGSKVDRTEFLREAREKVAEIQGRYSWLDPKLCRCGHPKHAAQCPAPEGCWCDTFTR